MLFFRDIERCPYVPKDPEYKEWDHKDQERLRSLVDARRHLLETSFSYLSHEDKNIRNMAKFIIWILDRKD